MCNLYNLHKTRDAVGKLFKVSDNRMATFPEQLTMFPGRDAPVVRISADGEHELVIMSWGFVFLQAGKAPRRVTNTRDDKMQSAFWRGSIEERRCLVPVSSFAEPDDAKPVLWHWYALRGDEPRPLFAFAGLWRKWKGPIKKDGPVVEIETYSFMTTAANAFTEAINHDRLPAILATSEDQEAWLHGKPGDWQRLLQPFAPDRMKEVQVGLDKLDLMKD